MAMHKHMQSQYTVAIATSHSMQTLLKRRFELIETKIMAVSQRKFQKLVTCIVVAARNLF